MLYTAGPHNQPHHHIMPVKLTRRVTSLGVNAVLGRLLRFDLITLEGV